MTAGRRSRQGSSDRFAGRWWSWAVRAGGPVDLNRARVLGFDLLPGRDDPGGTITTANKPSADGLNWAALAQCESGGNASINTGNGFYGLYQFDLQTWRSVGGSGYPHQNSASEQTYRAQILYSQRGDSPWPSCGSRLYS